MVDSPINLPPKGVFPSSQVHPQKQSHLLRVESYSSSEWATEPITLNESIFRHSGWSHRRRLVFDSLRRTGVGHRRLEAFCDCGAITTCEATHNEVRVCGSSCRHPLCEPCRQERAAKIRANLYVLCIDKEIRFLTLTLRHSDTALTAQLDRLYRSFSLLRRRKEWAQNVKGGAAFCEVKISERDGLYHPHLHILIEGQWWEHKEISRLWHEITGDSTVVDITRPRVIEDVCAYAVGYCTKSIHSSCFTDPDRLDEVQVSLRGRRMCLTFGEWRGQPLEATEKDERVWVSLGRLDTVIKRASEGVKACREWLEAAVRRYPSISQLVHPTISDEEFIP